MSEDLEKPTTFFIKFGTFKYLVMPFGFCNRSVSLQYLINNTLFDFLYYFI